MEADFLIRSGFSLRLVAFSISLIATSVYSQTNTQAPIPTYQDKLIDGNLPPDTQEAAEQAYDRTGLPRSYSLESSWDQRGIALRTQVLGLRATGLMDTLYWGSFSGQIGLQQGRSQQQSSASQTSQQVQWQLRQQGMPLEGGWALDNALGQINLPVPELSRNSLRLGLPTAGMLGIASQWRQAEGLQIQAAAGKTGEFSGFPVASFSTTGGQYAYLSVRDHLKWAGSAQASRWAYNVALAAGQNLPASSLSLPAGIVRVDAQSLYVAAQRMWPTSASSAAPPATLQINLMHSQSQPDAVLAQKLPSAQGVWLDGSFRQGSHLNQWGVFYLEPQLRWLEAPVASDLQGGYWRHSWRTRQWSAESGLELLKPVIGNAPAGYFAKQALRYQYSTVTSFGTSLSLRNYNGDAQAALVYAQWAHGWGITRLQAEAAHSEPADRLVRLQMDHEFGTSADLRLATSLSLDREKRNGLPARGFGWSFSADWQFAPNISFTQSLQARSSDGQLQYTLQSGLSWRIAPQWSLNATVFAVQGNPQLGSLVQSPLTAPVVSKNNLQDKGVFVSLRYTQAAGSSQVPIGGTTGSAAGSVQGAIFFDDNGNGKQEASERGAAQITVQLNGKFSVDTDAQGRFEFPYVATGSHTLQVISDNLPLPWSMPTEGKQTIRVNTRDVLRLSLGAVKP